MQPRKPPVWLTVQNWKSFSVQNWTGLPDYQGRLDMILGEDVGPLWRLGCWLAGNDPEAVGLLDDADALGRAGCDVPLSSQEADLVDHRNHPLVVNREVQI